MSELENNLFYTCSLIEYISRKTTNKSKDVVNNLGVRLISHIFELADVLHCENIEEVADRYIGFANIENGNYTMDEFQYEIPSYWNIGKVYSRLILDVVGMDASDEDIISTLIEVYNSWIVDYIEDYDIAFYFLQSEYIFDCYKAGKILRY